MSSFTIWLSSVNFPNRHYILASLFKTIESYTIKVSESITDYSSYFLTLHVTKKTFSWDLRLRLNVLHKIEWNLESSQENHIIGFVCTIEAFAAPGHVYIQSCKWNERSLNRGVNWGRGLGSDETFFWNSCSNLEIHENFRISHKLGLGLAAKISQAFAIQLDRFRGQ